MQSQLDDAGTAISTLQSRVAARDASIADLQSRLAASHDSNAELRSVVEKLREHERQRECLPTLAYQSRLIALSYMHKSCIFPCL